MSTDTILKQWDLLSVDMPTEETLSLMDKMRAFYRTRTTKSGNMLEVEGYPLTPKGMAATLRKIKASSEVQKKLNQKNAERRMWRLAEANFGPSDYKVELTFADEYLPTLDQMHRVIRNFVRRLNDERKRRGIKTGARYIAVIEGGEEGSKQHRLHVHMIVDGDLGRDDIKRIWGRGRIACEELDPNGYGGLKRLVQYMSKDPKGRKRWVSSKNLKKPIVSVADRKVNHKTAKKIAEDKLGAIAALEKLYKGYRCEDIEVRTNPYIPGIYFYAQMRKEEEKHEQGNRNGKPGSRSGNQTDAKRNQVRAVSDRGAQGVQKRGRKA